MLVPFLTARRRQRLLDTPLNASSAAALEEHVALYKRLPSACKAKLRDIARVLVAEKTWEGCGPMKGKLSDEMKLVIAAQAGVLLLGLGLDPLRDDLYPNMDTVLVYPSAFTSTAPRPVGTIGNLPVMGEGFANLGEAWDHGAGAGPVVLSWADALRGSLDMASGHNVVLHEFAHKLDMLDGSVNGTPLLESREDVEQWKNVMTGSYIALSRSAALGMPTVLSPYGATSPGEFFAVATEAFFQRPHELRASDTPLYETLAHYYKQDPARWEQSAC